MILLQRFCFILITVLFSASIQAATPAETYYQLQSFKHNVQSAYIYALIVDEDARAHTERNDRLKVIDDIIKFIEQSDIIAPEQRKELLSRSYLYLRAAKHEADTYEVNFGSRTASNGLIAYTELLELINISIKDVRASAELPKKTLTAFNLINNVTESVEIHSERTLKSDRSGQFSQQFISSMCKEVKKGLIALGKTKNAKAAIKKASLKWSFIKTPVCNMNKTSAPFTIVYYSGLMIDELQPIVASELTK